MNAKQQRFCEEYVIDSNGTQAAIRAGYSKNSARQIADQLLTKLDISQRVNELKLEIQKRNEITADFVLNSLKEVALRCMTATPVMVFENGRMQETGEYEFDSAGANKALELLGKHLALFNADKKPADQLNLLINSVEVKVISSGLPQINNEKDIIP